MLAIPNRPNAATSLRVGFGTGMSGGMVELGVIVGAVVLVLG